MLTASFSPHRSSGRCHPILQMRRPRLKELRPLLQVSRLVTGTTRALIQSFLPPQPVDLRCLHLRLHAPLTVPAPEGAAWGLALLCVRLNVGLPSHTHSPRGRGQ